MLPVAPVLHFKVPLAQLPVNVTPWTVHTLLPFELIVGLLGTVPTLIVNVCEKSLSHLPITTHLAL